MNDELKDSVILYRKHYRSIKHLSLEEKGSILDAIFAEEPTDLSPAAQMAFSFIQVQIEIDTEKYQAKCKRNKDNADKRWHTKNANASERMPNDAKNANASDGCRYDNDMICHDNDIKKENNTKEKATRFSPPTPEEIKSYCNERNNQVDAERFFDFYQSKNWMIGKNKMKDWKAAVRTWEREEKQKGGKDENSSKQVYNID